MGHNVQLTISAQAVFRQPWQLGYILYCIQYIFSFVFFSCCWNFAVLHQQLLRNQAISDWSNVAHCAASFWAQGVKFLIPKLLLFRSIIFVHTGRISKLSFLFVETFWQCQFHVFLHEVFLCSLLKLKYYYSSSLRSTSFYNFICVKIFSFYSIKHPRTAFQMFRIVPSIERMAICCEVSHPHSVHYNLLM